MTARRVISVLSAGLIASVSVAAAQPTPTPTPPAAKKAPKAKAGKKAPLAPAKDATTPAKGATTPAKDGTTPAKGSTAPAKGSTAPAKGGTTPAKGDATGSASNSAARPAGGPGAASTGEGSTVQMTEDPPPSDMSGVNENPDAPKSVMESEAPAVVTVAPAPRRTGYPLEAVLRPITLPQNMSEVSLNPHAAVSPYASATALRARYGITPKIQLGLTYMLGGIFDDPSTPQAQQAFHPGKAVGLDVTVMLQDWIGVQVGVPVYISPLAVSVTLGAPIKFAFGDKYAIGGLDDLLNIRVSRFAPTFYQELQNATAASAAMINTINSQGELRFSVFGLYQYQPNLAFIGRTGIQMEDFASGKTDGCNGECLTTYLYAGLTYSPRRYLDLGLSIGFDDLAHGGSFAPAGFLAFRI